MSGVVQRRDTGRPELVYGRRCAHDMVEHEVRVTDVALCFPGAAFARGVKVNRAEPDLVMILDGRRCFVEVDNSEKMTAKQMAQKWERYGAVEGFILVVCRTEGRLERLRAGAEAVKDAAIFTTFERLRAGLAWVDWYGNTVVI